MSKEKEENKENKENKEFRETQVFIASVEFHNEVTNSPDVMDHVIFAKSFKKAEKGIEKSVGEHLIKIRAISIMNVVPIF